MAPDMSRFEMHPMPVNVRPDGQDRFDAMSKAEQDKLFGPEKAQLLRDGKITLAECVGTSPLKYEPDFITAKPLDQIKK